MTTAVIVVAAIICFLLGTAVGSLFAINKALGSILGTLQVMSSSNQRRF